MKQKGIIILIFTLLIIGGGIFGYLLYNKPHKDLEKAKIDFEMKSIELLEAFENNYSASEELYNQKVILVSGSIQTINISENNVNVVLAEPGEFFGVNCSFSATDTNQLESIKEGDYVSIKGECQGYLDDVILTNCVLVK